MSHVRAVLRNRVCVEIGLAVFGWAMAAPAQWVNILTDSFDDAAPWAYTGVQNGSGQNLFSIQSGVVSAEWDAGYGYNPAQPDIIQTSFLARPLALALTDADAFRVRVSVMLHGIKSQTGEAGYQISSFGLFNPALMGQNRAYIDPDGDWVSEDVPRNFAEFSYFLYNYYGGSNVQPNLFSGDRTHLYGDNETVWGAATLPLDQALYLELEYDPLSRRAVARAFEDAGYTQIMTFGGKTLEEYTQFALAAGESFTLTHVGFFNYQAVDWLTGGPLSDVGGTGSFDSLSVAIPEPGGLALVAIGGAALAWIRARHRSGD
ncbi:MAG: hypothetical protein KBA51_02895 [Kiritimatiellae bacterium]|nr:hypothetical protein [Kiritimatiellia bacterium]